MLMQREEASAQFRVTLEASTVRPRLRHRVHRPARPRRSPRERSPGAGSGVCPAMPGCELRLEGPEGEVPKVVLRGVHGCLHGRVRRGERSCEVQGPRPVLREVRPATFRARVPLQSLSSDLRPEILSARDGGGDGRPDARGGLDRVSAQLHGPANGLSGQSAAAPSSEPSLQGELCRRMPELPAVPEGAPDVHEPVRRPLRRRRHRLPGQIRELHGGLRGRDADHHHHDDRHHHDKPVS